MLIRPFTTTMIAYEGEGAAAGGGAAATTVIDGPASTPADAAQAVADGMFKAPVDPAAAAASQAIDPAKAATDAAAAATAVTEKAAADKIAADAQAATDAAKAVADKAIADKALADKAAADAAKVPDKYEFKVEGIELDPAQVEAFTPIAKELGLTQEAAQKLVEFQAGIVKAQNAAAETQRTGWLEAAKADKDMGGPKFDTTVNNAKIALAKFGSAELKGVLNASGLGNHPEIIRAFAKVGAAMSSDDMVTGGQGGGSGGPKTLDTIAERMFGKPS